MISLRFSNGLLIIALRQSVRPSAPWIDTKKISPRFSINNLIYYPVIFNLLKISSHSATFTLLIVIVCYQTSRETLVFELPSCQ